MPAVSAVKCLRNSVGITATTIAMAPLMRAAPACQRSPVMISRAAHSAAEVVTLDRKAPRAWVSASAACNAAVSSGLMSVSVKSCPHRKSVTESTMTAMVRSMKVYSMLAGSAA